MENSKISSASHTKTPPTPVSSDGEKSTKSNHKHNPAPKSSKKPKKSPLSTKTNQLKSKLLSTYYGHPARDMKLICIAGTTGKTTVARFVHDILGSADQQVAIFSSDAPFKASTLHKFLSDAWKAGATHAVITAPAAVISAQAFHGLPIHLVALTDFEPSVTDPAYIDDHLRSYSTLLGASPAHVVLNRDDTYYPDFAAFTGTDSTLTYGTSPSADLRIDSSKLYKLGAEANLSLDRAHFTVASFLTGQPVISHMAAAAAIATALHVAPAIITEGIALYDPDNTSA